MTVPFPWLALGIGLLIALLQLGAGDRLPLLTRLIVAEFGFFLTLIGAGLALRDLRAGGLRATLLLAAVGCGLLAAGFLWLGLQLWPTR